MERVNELVNRPAWKNVSDVGAEMIMNRVNTHPLRLHATETTTVQETRSSSVENLWKI